MTLASIQSNQLMRTPEFDQSLTDLGLDPSGTQLSSNSATFTHSDGSQAILELGPLHRINSIKLKTPSGTISRKVRIVYGPYGSASQAFTQNGSEPESLAITFNYDPFQRLSSYYDHTTNQLMPYQAPANPFPPNLLPGGMGTIPPADAPETETADAYSNCLNACLNTLESGTLAARHVRDDKLNQLVLGSLAGTLSCMGLVAPPLQLACLLALTAALALLTATIMQQYWEQIALLKEQYDDCCQSCSDTFNNGIAPINRPQLVDLFVDPFNV